MSVDATLTIRRIVVLREHRNIHPASVPGCFNCRNLARWENHKKRDYMTDDKTRRETRNWHRRKKGR